MCRSYEITREKDDIVVRFNGKLVDRSLFSRMLGFIELEALRRESESTREEAEQLAGEIDQSVWQQIKHKYTGD